MSALLKPKRKLRIEHNAGGGEIHDDGHAWAVSYADFLMVLLSFFVIFFSIDSNKKETLIDNIVAKSGFDKTKGSGGKESDRTLASFSTLPSGIQEVGDSLEGFFVEKVDGKQKLYIYLDDDIYLPGKIDLPPKQIENLKQILRNLEPFNGKINITFIGHTDKSVVSTSKSNYVKDNFDLSSLRATRALQQAVKADFDPSHMFAQGVAEHTRGSRTLSLVITPREANQ
jgi:flagellar motor protein MotB